MSFADQDSILFHHARCSCREVSFGINYFWSLTVSDPVVQFNRPSMTIKWLATDTRRVDLLNKIRMNHFELQFSVKLALKPLRLDLIKGFKFELLKKV